MEKFVVYGEYCKDVINKREPYRDEHLKRLSILKEEKILITLGPTKCTRYLFGIFYGNSEKEVRDHLEADIYWKKGIWIKIKVHHWIQAF